MSSLPERNRHLNPALTADEIRVFHTLVDVHTRAQERHAFSRFVAHLTPTTAQWLSDLTIPVQMWRG